MSSIVLWYTPGLHMFNEVPYYIYALLKDFFFFAIGIMWMSTNCSILWWFMWTTAFRESLRTLNPCREVTENKRLKILSNILKKHLLSRINVCKGRVKYLTPETPLKENSEVTEPCLLSKLRRGSFQIKMAYCLVGPNRGKMGLYYPTHGMKKSYLA